MALNRNVFQIYEEENWQFKFDPPINTELEEEEYVNLKDHRASLLYSFYYFTTFLNINMSIY